MTHKPPGSAAPSFSVNGTNASKNTTVTFSHEGYYSFDVALTDAQGYTMVSSVGVNVSDVPIDLGIFTDANDIGSPPGRIKQLQSRFRPLHRFRRAATTSGIHADQFQFTSRNFTGNGSIIARVDSVENTNTWAKAGVMFRDSSAAGAMFADVVVTPSSGVSFQWRNATNGTCDYVQITGQTAPKWVKLTRSGNSFTAYYATTAGTPTEANWIQIGTPQTIAMNSAATVGLAVTSHNNGNLCTSVFSNVSVTTPPLPNADFDSDGDIDGRDFLAWQRGYGIQAPNATKADGDADNDLDVDGDDLGIWQEQFGTAGAMAAAALLSESVEATSRVIAEPVSVESPTVANALQPLSAELVDVAIAWELASRPRQKVHPVPAALVEKVHSDRLPPAVSRAQSMPWHAGSNTAKHLVFGRADAADDIFDSEGDDAVYEQLLDRLFAEDESVRSAMRIFMFAR